MTVAQIGRTRQRHGYRTRLWTREEYHRAAELGLFGPQERLELIEGEIVEKVAPQKSAHFSGIEAGARALEVTFGGGFTIRRQGPIVLSDSSEPEPDLAVVVGTWQDYVGRHPHPEEVRLVVEVSDTTLRFDRGRKASLYARAGIADYWIVNLNARTLEVCRLPTAGPTARSRWTYKEVRVLSESDSLSSIAAPAATLLVSALLPPRPLVSSPASGEETGA